MENKGLELISIGPIIHAVELVYFRHNTIPICFECSDIKRKRINTCMINDVFEQEKLI